MGAVRAAHKRNGYTVLSATPTTQARAELRDSAGVENSRTLASVCKQLANGVKLPRYCVVIYDEAETRQTADLFAARRRADANVIEVGPQTSCATAGVSVTTTRSTTHAASSTGRAAASRRPGRGA